MKMKKEIKMPYIAIGLQDTILKDDTNVQEKFKEFQEKVSPVFSRIQRTYDDDIIHLSWCSFKRDQFVYMMIVDRI